MSITKRCPYCKTGYESHASFCIRDGVKLEETKQKVYSETSPEQGMWTIICRATAEFHNRDHAEEAINLASYDEDTLFDEYELIKGKITATGDKFPYICKDCRRIVTSDPEEYCGNCDTQNWEER